MNPPNIVYVHSHDTGRYIQPYGHSVPTPNLQRLAEEGILFRQAFSAAPTCSPSRAALLTGQWPHASGMLGLAHRGFSLNDNGQHIVHTLRRQGYISTLIGVQHVAADAGAIGYDRVVDVPDRTAHHVAPAAAEFLMNSPDEPFFLAVGFSETHRDFPTVSADADAQVDARYTAPPAPLPDTPATRKDMAAYKASARALDRGIGILLDALEAADLRDNTLVVYTTDHGPAFPTMKCSLTDHGIGVALIMRGPGGFTGGRVCDAMVSHVDIFPTLCEISGAEQPSWLQGTSLLPLTAGQQDGIRSELFAEVTYHAAYEPKRAVRTQRYKYIRRFGDRRRPVLPNCDDSPSKSLWLAHGWRDQRLAGEELYDLLFDPLERLNLASSADHQTVLEEMRARLDRWMEETDDPIRHGAVTAPQGAMVNDPNGLSPRDPAAIVSVAN